MKTVNVGTHTVQMYDSIDELPIVRFHKYQKYLLIESGIGSTIDEFDKHIEKARRFLMMNDAANAQRELENLRHNVYMMQCGLSPKHLAFACLVFAIDGKQCTDISDDGLHKVLETFADAPTGELTDHLDSVKKKIDTELSLYFPRLYEDADIKEYYEKVRKRTLLMLTNIVNDSFSPETDKEIDDLTTALITYTRPQNFNGSDSMEIKFDRQFENLCITLANQLSVQPKQYTVLEYYNAFEYLKDKIKADDKAAKQARTRR